MVDNAPTTATQDLFNSIIPGGSVVALPAFARQDTLGGIMYGDIVCVWQANIYASIHDDTLRIKLNTELAEDAYRRPLVPNLRPYVMRVCLAIPGEDLIEGFIADLRFNVTQGICKVMIEPPEDVSDAQRRDIEEGALQFPKLLAAVFTDPDGRNFYLGDNRLQDSMATLMAYRDRHIAEVQAESSQ